MFDSLTDRLGTVFDKLTRRGALSESDVDAALREVRQALLEADVALPVARDFIAQVRERAVGEEVVKSVTPGQMVVKIVNDTLVETLGSEAVEINLNAVPPAPIMLVGLQGSGKTTTTAKLAKRLVERDKKKVMMASLDTRRPAAMEQLKVLGEQIDVPTLPIVEGQNPNDIAKRAMQAAKLQGFDIILLDTAGRMHVDEALMAEVQAIHGVAKPVETLLVVDSLTGQDAVNVAEQFGKRLNLTGIVLTRVDGDGRGGAALSMRAVTGCPIKLLGVGEKLDEIETFHPDRIASRILGMGDVVSLVEKATENIDEQEADKLAKKIQKGQFDMNDLLDQLRQISKMGGLDGLMAMLPGVGKMKKQMAEANIDPKLIKRQEAIILSMTTEERLKPKVIHASRKKRIAAGAGTSVQEVNKLLKQFKQMSGMMKKVSKMGKKGMMRGLPGLGGQQMPGMQGMLPRR
ncbi:MAG: signal recognition particle protein [Rhodospirillaceae bacterium]|jgi:signal recognition particle subunit SRP54|nr:signal recognition particle protein [Rhodospirillaceae bacterium]MBT6430726.1 signal recognition particle protein [Rhodospirillaceae bacterium]MBT7757565.1 signal recognition particle protein [Rhodospirillaceae bacterium]